MTSFFGAESADSSLSRHLLDVQVPSVGFDQPITGASSFLNMTCQFSADAPVNATLMWLLPPPFAYVDLVGATTLAVNSQSNLVYSVTKNQTTRTVQITLVNNAAITAGNVFHLSMATIVPPSTGALDAFTIQLLSPENALLDTVNTQLSVKTQPSTLNILYVGMKSQRAGQDTGLALAFSPAQVLPTAGAVVIALNSLFNLTSSVVLNMLTPSGGYTTSQDARNVVKLQRNGDGSALSKGSILSFWLSGVWSPPTDGVITIGELKTTTPEGFIYEQANLSSMTVYSG
ncbi:unnamed protein product [Aphanomyces euteiches]